jgi:hypothetical protein
VQTSRPLLLALIACASAATPAQALPPEPSAAPVPLEGAPANDLSLTLGARAERGPYRSEVSGFLALAVPLERFAAPRSAAPEPADEPDEPEPNAEARAAEKRVPPVLPLLAAPVLSQLARDCSAAALRALHAAERRGELQGMAARSRSSALLPELRLRAARAQDESLRLTPTSDDPYKFTQDGGDDLVFEARATWKLNRLVFADEEIAIKRLELEQERSAERVSARVLALVLAWHEAVSRLRADDAGTRARADFDRLEAEVALDVLTGGWFATRAARLVAARDARTRPPPGAPPQALAGPAAGAGSAPAEVASSDLVEPLGSAKPAEPCLPMHETASKTF